MGSRSRAERDAITIETGYALVSAVFLASLLFGAVGGPALLFSLPLPAERALLFAGAVFAATGFVARVVHVLWRFPGRQAQRPTGNSHPDS